MHKQVCVSLPKHLQFSSDLSTDWWNVCDSDAQVDCREIAESTWAMSVPINEQSERYFARPV